MAFPCGRMSISSLAKIRITDLGAADAFRFMEALTRRLQVSSENVLPALEAEAESSEPAGYILPIRRRQPLGRLRWSSQWWFPRPRASAADAGRFAHRLSHSDRVDALGGAGRA